LKDDRIKNRFNSMVALGKFPPNSPFNTMDDSLLLAQVHQAYQQCIQYPAQKFLPQQQLHQLLHEFDQGLKISSIHAVMAGIIRAKRLGVSAFLNLGLTPSGQPTHPLAWRITPDTSILKSPKGRNPKRVAERVEQIKEWDRLHKSSTSMWNTQATTEDWTTQLMQLRESLEAIESPSGSAKLRSLPMSLPETQQKFKFFPWQAFTQQWLHALGYQICSGANHPCPITHFVVEKPGTLEALIKVIQSTPLPVIRLYLAMVTWKHLATQVELPHSPKSNGRNQICVQKVRSAFPLVYSRWSNLHHDRSVDHISNVKSLFHELKAKYAARLHRIPGWEPSTIAEAQRKIKQLELFIGYPEHFHHRPDRLVKLYHRIQTTESWPTVVISTELHQETNRFLGLVHYDLRALVEFDEIVLESNAAYESYWNVIIISFPELHLGYAAQDVRLPDYAMGATVGVTLAHEIAHALIGEGSTVLANGVTSKWWSENTQKTFYSQVTAPLIAEYNQWTFPLNQGTMGALSGQQTWEENGADFMGLSIAYQTWESRFRSASPQMLPGFPTHWTPSHLFFLIYAQKHCSVFSPEGYATLLTNPRVEHAPGSATALSTLRHFPPFTNTFQFNNSPMCAHPVIQII
jgi:hypothetical protein